MEQGAEELQHHVPHTEWPDPRPGAEATLHSTREVPPDNRGERERHRTSLWIVEEFTHI